MTGKFEHGGRWFLAEIADDSDSNRKPWDDDGHGPVDVRLNVKIGGRIPKVAGERVICDNGFETAFYDFAEAVKIAARDGWGWLPGPLATKEIATGQWQATAGELTAYGTDANAAISALYTASRSRFTPKAYAAKAAEADFARMKAWADDEWNYVGLVVTLLDTDNETPRPLYRESLWGIESDSGDYFEEAANELADEILARLGDA